MLRNSEYVLSEEFENYAFHLNSFTHYKTFAAQKGGFEWFGGLCVDSIDFMILICFLSDFLKFLLTSSFYRDLKWFYIFSLGDPYIGLTFGFPFSQ